MAASRKTQTTERVDIPELKMDVVQIPIRGLDGPLVCHNWSTKAISEMLAKQTHMRLEAKGAKDPEKNFKESLYTATDNSHGFPACAFKAAMVRAAKSIDGLDMKEARQLLFVVPDCREDRKFKVPLRVSKGSPIKYYTHRIQTDLVRIIGEPQMRMDLVRLNGMKADVRFRAEFQEWEAIITIRYVASRMTAQQVANLLSIAGGTVGCGEGRAEKSTDMGWGRWEIITKKRK